MSDAGESDFDKIEAHAEVSQMAIGMFQGFIDAGEAVAMNAEVAAEMFKVIMSGAMRLAFATEPKIASAEEIQRATEIVVQGAFVAPRR